MVYFETVCDFFKKFLTVRLMATEKVFYLTFEINKLMLVKIFLS